MAAPRTPARGGAKAAKIPQVSWREPRPAPVVLVFGPEEVCAERAIAGIRDYLRTEDPALEVSDVRADDYAPGTLFVAHLAVALRRTASRACLGSREVLRRVPARGGGISRPPAGGCDGHSPAHGGERPRQEAARCAASRHRRGDRDPVRRDQARRPTESTSRRGSSRRRRSGSRHPRCALWSPPSPMTSPSSLRRASS